MSLSLKNSGSAYGMAFLGLLLGIIGLHRFYVRRSFSAMLMSAVFLAGMTLLAYEIAIRYYALIDVVSQSSSGLLSFYYGDSPQINLITEQVPGNSSIALGIIICAVGFLWWLVDLLLIPGLVNKYNEEASNPPAGK